MFLRPRTAALAVALLTIYMLGLMLTRPRRRIFPSAMLSDDPKAFVYAFASGNAAYPMLSLAQPLSPACPGGLHTQPHVTVEMAGHLSHFILEYMSVWALAKEYNLPAFVPDRILRRLHMAFEELSVPAASLMLRADPECVRVAALAAGDPAAWEEWQPWGESALVDLNRVSVDEAVEMARARHSIVVLDEYVMLAEVIVPLLEELRTEMRLLSHLRTTAQEELHTLRRLFVPKFEDEVVFCAMAVSRAGDQEQLGILYGDVEPAGKNYYVAAARWLREKVPASKDLLFVITSDDRDWVEEYLLPAMDKATSAEREVGGAGWSAAWAGSGNSDGPERDLALLSACNHTIFAYGTFGLSAALLAGGHTAVYQIAPGAYDPILLTPSEQFARNIPGWVALR